MPRNNNQVPNDPIPNPNLDPEEDWLFGEEEENQEEEQNNAVPNPGINNVINIDPNHWNFVAQIPRQPQDMREMLQLEREKIEARRQKDLQDYIKRRDERVFNDVSNSIANKILERKNIIRKKKKVVGISYPVFLQSFKKVLPNLVVIEDSEDVKKCDIVLFPGGEDINPRIYGEINTKSYDINNRRDDLETNIYNHLSDKKRIVAICRGHQLINALTGGKLDQDYGINQGIYHNRIHTLEFREGINEDNSILYKFFNGKTVVSTHHQCVNSTNFPLIWTSKHQGIIETCESPYMLTMQFHPEFDPEKKYVKDFFKFIVEEW